MLNKIKNYQYILFDWDGCIARTLEIWLHAYKETFAEQNLYPTDREITLQVFGDWNGPKKFGVKDNDEYTKELLNKVNSNYPNAELYENSVEILRHIKSLNKKIALITSSKLGMLSKTLIDNNIENLFDIILTADDVEKHKPDPEIVFMALKELGGKKEQAIIIGDSKSDLGAAENAGVDSVLFYPKSHQLFYDLEHLESFNPNYVIKDLAELKKIIF